MTTTGAATEVTVRDLPVGTRISLRLGDPARAAAALGPALPARIGSRAVAGGRSALCLGPDEWLIEAPGDDAALSAALAGLAAETPLSAVDISDREIAWCLEGPAVLDLLATGCPLDLARMPVGNGTRTVFHGVQVVLTRESADRFHLSAWRSFAPHVTALLDLARAELASGL